MLRDVALNFRFAAVLITCGIAQYCWAEPSGEKKGAWTFGAYAIHHDLRSDEENNLKGISTAVQLGYGHIDQKWFVNTTLDIFSGPFKLRKSTSELDFAGTGGSVNLGYTFEPTLRKNSGASGLALGLTYSDIVGKSDDNNDDKTVRMKINNFSVFSGMVFCVLKPARPNDNKSENLVTRIEGYFLTLGISAPILAKYDLRYREEIKPEPTPEEPAPKSTFEPRRDRGRLKGYSLVVYLSTWLGV
ncbi:MAG: hypothetical protein AB7T49_04515 [Oligoflexales bacterium]